MEKVRVHYAQRMQSNLDQVAKEKEALRNWQMAMQHETQRVGEVIDLCGKQPALARWLPPRGPKAPRNPTPRRSLEALHQYGQP